MPISSEITPARDYCDLAISPGLVTLSHRPAPFTIFSELGARKPKRPGPSVVGFRFNSRRYPSQALEVWGQIYFVVANSSDDLTNDSRNGSDLDLLWVKWPVDSQTDVFTFGFDTLLIWIFRQDLWLSSHSGPTRFEEKVTRLRLCEQLGLTTKGLRDGHTRPRLHQP